MKCFNPSFSGRGAAHVHGVLWIDFQEVKAEGVNNYLLQEAYRKLKVSEPLEGYERNALERFTDSFVTVTRNVNLVGEEAVAIAEEVNWHSHSRSCFKGGRKTCRWKSKKARERPEVAYYKKMEEPDEYQRNIKSRIEDVLKIASAGGDEISYEKYEQAVMEQPRKGSEILLRRDIDETMLNQYNPEWIKAWNGNIDLSCVYDYYGTITYVTDYFTKVSPQSAI